MRIEQEMRNLYVGERQTAVVKTPAEMEESLRKGRVFTGKLQSPADKIVERRKEAQEKDEDSPAMERLEASTIQMVKVAETGELVQKELKHIVDRLKLDLEDLKGAAVDEDI